jgi:hypothetical protein
MWQMFFKGLLRFYKFDFIWVSSPEVFETLPKKLGCKLIYDCMDDILAFHTILELNERLQASEKKIIEVSDHIFCSSLNLYNKIINRGADKSKCTVVFNAFDEKAFTLGSLSKIQFPQKSLFSIGYIGTVSSWIDFSSIIYAVERIPNITFYFVGPIENLNQALPTHERIVFLGAIDHNKIQIYANSFDILIIPFLKLPLVESVDPVKLYEYIFFDKPIVSIYYDGLKRFEYFVNFYTCEQGLVNRIEEIIYFGSCKKISQNKRDSFIKENSWKSRSKIINKTLNGLKFCDEDIESIANTQ